LLAKEHQSKAPAPTQPSEMLIFKAVVTFLVAVSAANALNDPCASLRCQKPEIACIRLMSGESKYSMSDSQWRISRDFNEISFLLL